MAIATCDYNLGFLGMVLRASYFDPLNNGNPFAPPTDPVTAHVNAIVTAAQITEVARLYKDDREKFTTYWENFIPLISMITNKCPEKYMTTLKCNITKFYQYEKLNLLDHLYTEYRTITYSNLTANFYCMTACWNITTSITDLFQHLNYRKDFA